LHCQFHKKVDNVQPKTFSLKKKIIGIFVALFLVLVVLLVLDGFHIISLSKLLSLKNPFTISLQTKQKKAPTAIIMKVGNENIYQQDLNTELAYFPAAEKNEDREQLLKDKLIKDSTILQAAQEEALITLDSTVYNSSAKNYLKRIQLIAQVKDQLEKKKDRYKGSVVAIWFYDTRPGPIGYDTGKELALKKITDVRTAVAGNRITMEEAAKQIENDQSLAQVDPAYKANAYFSFDTDLKQDIVFDQDFNRIIKQLQKGQVSPVVVVKDKEMQSGKPTGRQIEAAYMFAQVDERTISGQNLGFDDWLARRLKKYEIIYY
jgi:hypothetical protein